MTLDELRQQIKQQIEQAAGDVAAKQAALRQAELHLSFLQGQLAALGQIQIEEKPVYSNGQDGADPKTKPTEPPGGPFLNG